MTGSGLVKYLAPWRAKREEAQRQLDALRRRDGETCRRCRRPLRFDLPSGHDSAPKVEPIGSAMGGASIDQLCLCHTRCNAEAGDNTVEVVERVRLRTEAASGKRKRRRAA